MSTNKKSSVSELLIAAAQIVKTESRPNNYSGQTKILSLLNEHGELTLSQLAIAMGIRTGSTSETTYKLVNKGMVQSKKYPQNKRKTYFKLTDTGRKYITDYMKNECSNTIEYSLDVLSFEEQHMLRQLLTKIIDKKKISTSHFLVHSLLHLIIP